MFSVRFCLFSLSVTLTLTAVTIKPYSISYLHIHKKGRMKEEMQAMAVPMLAGASAGVVSRIICHPIDTIKSKLQVEVAADRASLSSVLSRTLRSEGVPGLYRGIGSVYHRY